MAKYAIKHKDGILVSSVGPYFVNFSGSIKGAKLYSNKESAQKACDYLNKVTVKNGAKGNFYSVCPDYKYRQPTWLKNKKK